MKTKITGFVVSLFLLVSGAANADMPSPPPMSMPDSSVVYSDLQFVFGSKTEIDSFYIHEAGVYQATLTDFEWPAPFETLSLMIVQGFDNKVGVIDGSGSFTFDAAPGLYHAALIASINGEFNVSPMSFGPVTNVGVYGVQVAMVPEAEVWIMMLLGLGFVVYQLRRAKRAPSTATLSVA